MYKNNRILALIPARGGSKGLPGKNLRLLGGKPLIVWSVEAGLRSQHIDSVMVTTDSEEIARVSKKAGASVPFLRPARLASDDSPTFEAVAHALEYCKRHLGKTYDYIALLEPTSPLRERGDIDRMIEKLVDNKEKYDAIISVGEVREHPSLLKRIRGDKLQPFCRGLKATSRRQDNTPAYFPFGVAYIVRTSVLLREKSFYPRRKTFYLIQRHQNYEIDDLCDFLCVETILKHRENKR